MKSEWTGGGGPDRDHQCISFWVLVGHVVRSLLRGIVGPTRARLGLTDPQEAQLCD